MGFGSECGIVLRHALAHADLLWFRCILGKEPVIAVSRPLGLDPGQAEGVVRLLRSVPKVPSPERLALVAMKDWGLDDEDIGEMWGRSTRWAAAVRAQAEALREEEPIWPHLEYLDEGLQPTDPCPEELWRRAAELRSQRTSSRSSQAHAQGRMRTYSWNGRHASFISLIAPDGTRRGTEMGGHTPDPGSVRGSWEEVGDQETQQE
jgi:hypothetical protein